MYMQDMKSHISPVRNAPIHVINNHAIFKTSKLQLSIKCSDLTTLIFIRSCLFLIVIKKKKKKLLQEAVTDI